MPFDVGPEAQEPLVLEPGWSKHWTSLWKFSGAEVVAPVRDLGSMRPGGCEPVRRFSWRTTQHHRPGLQYMVSTGRHHGFESMAEQKLLLALDFAGDLIEVFSQPFRLRFRTTSGWREHTPDFLASTHSGMLLIDVRPANRVKPDDRVRFAATEEAGLACGWRYLVITGWLPHVMTTLDTVSSQRRPLTDRLRLQDELLATVAADPLPFGELVASTRVPVMARAYALHLVWHRRLSIDLAEPLTDRTLVHPLTNGRVR